MLETRNLHRKRVTGVVLPVFGEHKGRSVGNRRKRIERNNNVNNGKKKLNVIVSLSLLRQRGWDERRWAGHATSVKGENAGSKTWEWSRVSSSHLIMHLDLS